MSKQGDLKLNQYNLSFLIYDFIIKTAHSFGYGYNNEKHVQVHNDLIYTLYGV